MKPERLKVIAEGMHPQDYISVRIVDDRVIIRSELCCSRSAAEWEYKPDTTNNDQMVKIMEKLLIMGAVEMDKPFSRFHLSFAGTTYYGKTLNEAVCNAAYDHFKKQY